MAFNRLSSVLGPADDASSALGARLMEACHSVSGWSKTAHCLLSRAEMHYLRQERFHETGTEHPPEKTFSVASGRKKALSVFLSECLSACLSCSFCDVFVGKAINGGKRKGFSEACWNPQMQADLRCHLPLPGGTAALSPRSADCVSFRSARSWPRWLRPRPRRSVAAA